MAAPTHALALAPLPSTVTAFAQSLAAQGSSTFPSPVVFMMDVEGPLALTEILHHITEALAAWREGEVARHKQRSVENIASNRLGPLLSVHEANPSSNEQNTVPAILKAAIRGLTADHSLGEDSSKQTQSERFGTSITLSVYRPLGEWFDNLRQELSRRCEELPKDLVAALVGQIVGSSDCGHLELVKLDSREEAERVLELMNNMDPIVKTEVDGKQVTELGGVHELEFGDLVVLQRSQGTWTEMARFALGESA